MKEGKNILVVCAISTYHRNLAHLDDVNFHFLNIDYHARLNILNFDILKYLNKARKYIKTHKIDGILYLSDIGSLVAAVLCKEFKFPGPSIESVFLCYHKYYTRKCTHSQVNSVPVALNKKAHHTFPFFLKAPCSTAGVLGFTIRNDEEFGKAITLAKKELPSLNHPMFPLFRKYVNVKKYPLALKNVMLVEDLITAKQVTIEGFVYKGKVTFMAIAERNHAKGSRLVDFYNVPTTVPKRIIEKLKRRARKDLKRVKLDNSPFNSDYWVTDDKIRLIEINSRVATLFYNIFREVLGYDSSRMAVELCLGMKPSAKSHKVKVGGLFNINTTQEGKAHKIFNYKKKLPFKTHMNIEKDHRIKQLSEFGQVMARFEVYGKNYKEMKHIADVYRKKVLTAFAREKKNIY